MKSNKPLTVLQVLPRLDVGGVETGTVDFARHLQKKGHRPIVVSAGGAKVRELESAGIPHFTLPVDKKSLISVIQTIPHLRKIIQEEKVDIVHARSRVPAWIAFFACRHTSAQFITTCHGYYSRHLFSRVMGWPKRVIVPSRVIGRHMVEDFGVPGERIRVIPRSVNFEKFPLRAFVRHRPSDHPPTIALIGRLTPLKGVDFFLRAMARVARSYPYIRVWVIGNAPKNKENYRRQLEQLAVRLGIPDKVEFLGRREDVADLLKAVDVVVMASVEPESFGRVIVEAQACGVPVVATHVGGVVDIIENEKTGLSVPPKDETAMAQAVMRLIKDRALGEKLTQAAQEKIKELYTLETMAEKTLEVYRELLTTTHILMIKLSALGDVVLTTPAFKAVRQRFPQSRLVVLVGKASRQVLQRCPWIDELIVMDTDKAGLGHWAFWRAVRRCAAERFDKIIDFQNNRRSHWIAFLSFARESYGFDNGKWSFFLSHRVPLPRDALSPVEHQFRLLEPLGIRFSGKERLALWPSPENRKALEDLLAGEWLAGTTRLVGLNLAASERWPTKNWPEAFVTELAERLAQKNIRLVLTGLPHDKAAALRIVRDVKFKPVDCVGKTDVLTLALLIQRCAVYITPDSAPLHIAAAMKTPLVALFGPTDPRRHCPPADDLTVIQKSLPCVPCYSGACRIRTHACMKEISPAEVERVVLAALARREKRKVGA